LNGKLSVSMGRTIFRDIKSNYAISQNITAVPWKLKVPTQFQIFKRKLSREPLIFQQNIYRRKIPQQCYRNWPNLSRQLEWGLQEKCFKVLKAVRKLSVSLGRTNCRDRKSNYSPVWTISQNITAVPWKLKVLTQFQILKRKRHSTFTMECSAYSNNAMSSRSSFTK
jgi:hypothetical protein